MTHNKLTVVSNRLPITLTSEGIERSSGGLVSALEGVNVGEHPMRWLGWPGREVPLDDQPQIHAQLEELHGCTPVFLSDALARDHYEGFSNSSVWPLFHSMPGYFQYRSQWWDAYRKVNERFAQRVLDTTAEGDRVWVHDYQLMLLPQMLKAARPSLRVGFFLHTPFPSSDMFRAHPKREELLNGLLGADLLGFHTFGYLRHFRSTVLRLMGLESEITAIRHEGHTCVLGVFPIGINARRFAEELETPRFRDRCIASTAAYAGKRVVLSVERLDYTKGIIRRLESIEIFLSRLSAAQRDEVRFVFISVPTRGGVDEYRALREEVEHRIGRINGQYATLNDSPIHFLHQSVGFTELCALYAVADVAIVTPLIDGMNLVAKEYVACQREDATCPARANGSDGPGVLILSEFAGAAQELPNALTVNPYDAPGVAEAIAQALAMPPAERLRRMRPMRERVFTHDAATWARDFIGELSSRPARPSACAGGIAAARRQLAELLRDGGRVALFLDYDGTLREIVRDPGAATPTPEISGLLQRIAGLSHADLTIISGRTASDLDVFFCDHPEFGLVAEHGAEVKAPGQSQWVQLDQNLDLTWKHQVYRILQLYQRSTPGTHIESKRTGLVWHYRQSDPEFGKWKANQLVDELSIVAANKPIEVRHGRKIVEVSGSQINKGAAVLNLLRNRPYELVLLVGDDMTDESMFRLSSHDPRMITIRIGEGDTRAQFRLPNPREFRSFLQSVLPVQPLISDDHTNSHDTCASIR